MGRSFVAWMLVLALCGCEDTVFVPYVVTKTTKPDTVTSGPSAPVPPDRPATSIVLTAPPNVLDIPGTRRSVHVYALDREGEPTGVEEVVVTSSDTSVAVVVEALPFADPWGYGPARPRLGVTLLEKAPGVTMLRATLGSLFDSLELRVEPVPGPSTAVVVDSFSVAEFRYGCGSATCLYVVYAPWLQVHEPTGMAEVTIVAADLELPTWSSGWTSIEQPIPATPVSVFCLDPYLWLSTLLHAQLDGTPLPLGPARVRLLTRDGLGTLGIVEVTGSVERDDHFLQSDAAYCR